jgi:hypothetical protein
MSENCQTVSTLQECKKCCSGAECNKEKLKFSSAGKLYMPLFTTLMAVLLAVFF